MQLHPEYECMRNDCTIMLVLKIPAEQFSVGEKMQNLTQENIQII